MRIVVLDGYALNPGDLSWEAFRSLGELVVHDRTPPALVVERAKGADAVLTNKTLLDRAALLALPKLAYVGVLATGYNVVDLPAAAEAGIVVTNVPAYGTRSVAQLTFALILALCHHAESHSEGARAGEWSASPDFCYWKRPLVELDGKTLGIVGFGRIGREVAKLAAAFGMKVLADDRSGRRGEEEGEVERAPLAELLGRADIVSLHCPLTAETRGLVDARTLALMRPGAFLVNTARGGLVVEEDLARALREGCIAGAAVDVLSTEPPSPDNPLLSAPNCIVTPHFGWAAREARERLLAIAAENLGSFMRGEPRNVVT